MLGKLEFSIHFPCVMIKQKRGMYTMMEQLRTEILSKVSEQLGNKAAEKIENAVTLILCKYEVKVKKCEVVKYDNSNMAIVKQYAASLKLEGKSDKTIYQYLLTIRIALNSIQKNIKEITTADIRKFLVEYQETKKISKSSLDNQRRYLSAFFSWLCAEEFIDKNPMLRIKKIKSDLTIKKPFSDVEIEKIRNSCRNIKEKALVEFLLSTGCRVSEVAELTIDDIDFDKSEAIVYGKGAKERKVYISDKAMFYLKRYLDSRNGLNISLFLNRNNLGMTKQNIETLVHKLGKRAGVENTHPHRFRRTFATNAINKGMKVQNVQIILGHNSLDTTMKYCKIDEKNVKLEHRMVA